MKACRMFNPRNCGILPKDPMRFSAIHLKNTVPRCEFDLYINILGPQFVNTNQDLDSITFWKSIQHRVHALASVAKVCVCGVLNSAGADRSNSIYNIVFY